MSRIKAKNTKLESGFLSRLSAVSHRAGFRYRKHYSKLAGKPDIVFPKRKVAIFIDGCFWHGCKKHSRIPLSNVSYWEGKIARNVERDKEVSRMARRSGWKILRLWEHEVKKQPERAVGKVMALISR